MPDKVRIDFQNTKNIYSVWEDEKWELAATEYIYLFDGSKKMRAKNRSKEYFIQEELTYIKKIANYKEGIRVEEILIIDPFNQEVEHFPKERIVICHNCEGKILQFEYRDILYTGKTEIISSPFSFGHNMKLEWQEGAYFMKVYQQKVASDKILVKYRPTKPVEEFRVRLFDPVVGNVTLVDKQIIHIEYWNTTTSIYNYTEECIQHPGNLSWTSCRNFSHNEVTPHNRPIIDEEWQELTIDGITMNVSELNVWCWDDEPNEIIWCKSIFDGDGRLKIPRIKKGESYFTISYASPEKLIEVPETHLSGKYENKLNNLVK